MSSGPSVTAPNGGLGIDSNGNIYISGAFATPSISIGADTLLNTDPTAATCDFFLAKFDSSGNPLWAKKFGGANNDFVNAIAVPPSGNVYISGSYQSAGIAIGSTTLTNAGTADNLLVAKFDTYGNPRWAKSAVGNTSTFNAAEAITTDQAESVYFTGGFTIQPITFGSITLTGNPAGSPFVVKYDSSGNVRWAKTATGAASQGYGISADKCGNVWVCGQMSVNMNFSGHVIDVPAGSYSPMYMVEYDTAGDYINGMALQEGGGGLSAILVDNQGDFFVNAQSVAGPSLFSFDIGADVLTIDSDYQSIFIARYTYGSECKIDSATSIKPVPEPGNDIILFPNPANSFITIQSGKNLIRQIAISNAIGQIVYTRQYNILQAEVNVSSLPPGVYYVKINGTEVRKFIKEYH